MKKNQIPNAKRMIIRDAVDIETEIKDEIPVDKTSLTDSEEVRYSTFDLRHQHLKIFSLLTTSDKEINLRMYPDNHVQDMCRKHSWTVPYSKPLQTNHDIYVDCNARFFDSWYLNHNDLKAQYGYGELPQGVIDEFNKRGAFNEGTGSTIGMAETNNIDFKRKIIDGTYLTTSQGAATNSLTCNVCGNSYRDYDKCHHMRGSTYPIFSEDGKSIVEMRRCIPYTGELEAVEDSVVNQPANDTSTLLIFDMKKNRVVNMSNVHEYSDIFDVVKPQTSTTDTRDEDTTKNVLEDNKQAGLTEEQIKVIQKMIDEGKQPSVTILNSDSKNTDPVTDNQTEDENDKGGHMSYKIKNATARRIFKEDMKSLGVNDMEKVSALFDKYDDNQMEFAMDLLGFIQDSREEVTVTDEPAQPEQAQVTDDKTQTTTENVTDTTENPEDKANEGNVTDSEEYKALKDQLDKAMKMLCDLKGIDNEVPDLATLEAQINDTKKPINKINDFDF